MAVQGQFQERHRFMDTETVNEYLLFSFDGLTGETIVRPMTEEEIAELDKAEDETIVNDDPIGF